MIDADNFEQILKTYEGRRFVSEVLDYCRVFEQSYIGDGDTEFREGRRAVGLQLLKYVFTIGPEKLSLIITEQQDREKKK